MCVCCSICVYKYKYSLACHDFLPEEDGTKKGEEMVSCAKSR